MTLSAETTGLLTGLAFSLAVFAFKTATGEFYVLTASSENAGQKRGFLLTATAAYAAVFLLEQIIPPTSMLFCFPVFLEFTDF